MMINDTAATERRRDPGPASTSALPPRDPAAVKHRAAPGWLLWGAWMGATLLGGILYLAILLLQIRLGQDPAGWLIGGSILAIGLAVVAQWVLLRCYFGKVSLWRWLGENLIGWLLLYWSVGGVWGLAYHWANDIHEDFGRFWLGVGLVAGVAFGLVGGAVLGALQARELGRYLHGPSWIRANTIAAGLIPLLAILLWSLFRTIEGDGAAVIRGESVIKHSYYSEDSPWPLLTLATLLLIGGAGGLVFARYTRRPAAGPSVA